MSLFPLTSLTLLQKLAVEKTGGNEASWVRFFNLYTPAIRRFVEWNDHVHDPDDVVQEVYLKGGAGGDGPAERPAQRTRGLGFCEEYFERERFIEDYIPPILLQYLHY